LRGSSSCADRMVASRFLYYAEHLDLAPGATYDHMRALYEARRAQQSELEFNLLIDRIGKLGPDPRTMAVWGRRPGRIWKASHVTSTTGMGPCNW
jgi:hypothetical protein